MDPNFRGFCPYALPMENYDPSLPVGKVVPYVQQNPDKFKREKEITERLKTGAVGSALKTGISSIPILGPALTTGYDEVDKAARKVIERETAEGYYNAIRGAFTKIDQRLNEIEQNIDFLFLLNGEDPKLLPDLSLSREFSGEVGRDAILAKGKPLGSGGKCKKKCSKKKKQYSRKNNKRSNRTKKNKRSNRTKRKNN